MASELSLTPPALRWPRHRGSGTHSLRPMGLDMCVLVSSHTGLWCAPQLPFQLPRGQTIPLHR